MKKPSFFRPFHAFRLLIGTGVLFLGCPFAFAATLLHWNFQDQVPDAPIVEPVEALPDAVFSAPLQAPEVGDAPLAVADAPSRSVSDLTKSARFDSGKLQFFRTIGLGKNLTISEGEPFTIEAWVKVPEKSPDGTPYVCSNRDPQRGVTGLALFAKSEGGMVTPVFIVTAAGSSVGASSPVPLSPGDWHHIAGVRYENGRLAIFIDGVEVQDSGARVQPGALDSYVNFVVGRTSHNNDAANFWNGEIAEVRLTSEALAPERFIIKPSADPRR